LHNGSNWTIEFFVFHSGSSLYGIVGTTAFGAQIGMSVFFNNTNNGGLVNGAQVYFANSVGDAAFNSSATLVQNSWNYVAITFTSSTKTCAFYINGAAAGSSSNTGFSYNASAPTNTLGIGRYQGSSPGGYLPGYISNLRISNVVRTGLTTYPTTPYGSDANTSLLTNFTNAGIYDAAWQNNALTVGDAQVSTTQAQWPTTSMKFDGTGDYLLLPDSVNLQIGSGDYTIEFWLYASSLAGSFSGIVDTRTSGGVDTNGFTIYFATSQLRFRTNGSDILTYSSFPTGTWTYVAITRSGSGSNNTKLFINGTQQAQATNTTSFTQTSRFVIGTTYPLTGDFYNGYIQDLRITKGVARTITTPTAAFPTR